MYTIRRLSRWHRYDRFTTYLLLGPNRTILKAWRHHAATTGYPIKGRTTPGAWTRASSQYEWVARAEHWDAAELASAHHVVHRRVNTTRTQNLQSIHHLVADVVNAIHASDLQELSRQEARALLPVLRPLLRDLLQAQRLELNKLEHTLHSDPDIVNFQQNLLRILTSGAIPEMSNRGQLDLSLKAEDFVPPLLTLLENAIPVKMIQQEGLLPGNPSEEEILEHLDQLENPDN